jgi:hypothetical protein
MADGKAVPLPREGEKVRARIAEPGEIDLREGQDIVSPATFDPLPAQTPLEDVAQPARPADPKSLGPAESRHDPDP